ncbi:PGPGW domain-containing protein [Actinotalea sp. C106]|uniref:PGPGW domain-containing protein n=1 Tax=Actinotalea sp. C106 TaxID=2908644 RepID=UPI0020297F5F|nr:PGPGW domain-containing protein [Actinotalea sp. C106]
MSYTDTETRARVHPVTRLRDRLRAHPATSLGYRIIVATVATVIILAGVAMLVLPGPGIATILLGLAVLGAEFPWARRLLVRILDLLRKARDRAVAWWRVRRGMRDQGASADRAIEG